jgi:SAM-dependent methyltransferase
MAEAGAGSHYDPQQIASYFDQYGLQEWDRLVQTPVQEVKLHIHTHYLEAYIPHGARVLEIGAGPGRFTQVLAGLGCRVMVADISPVQLDLNRRHARELGFADAVEDWRRLDICAMGELPDDSFDAVVCYGGPLSYVFEQAGLALDECTRVVKESGLLLLSVMSLWGSAHAFLPAVLSLPSDLNQTVIRTGDTLEGPHRCHMFRAAELRQLLEQTGWHVQIMSASNVLATGWDSGLAQIRQDEVRWGELLRMELEACREAGCLDMGTHLIAVARHHALPASAGSPPSPSHTAHRTPSPRSR